MPMDTTDKLEDLRDELTILYFMLKCNPVLVEIKLRSICEYIASKIDDDKDLSPRFILSYLKYIDPVESVFYKALENMAEKPKEEALDLLRQALKIGISDGGLNYSERLYLSEIVQAYREKDINIDIEF